MQTKQINFKLTHALLEFVTSSVMSARVCWANFEVLTIIAPPLAAIEQSSRWAKASYLILSPLLLRRSSSKLVALTKGLLAV